MTRQSFLPYRNPVALILFCLVLAMMLWRHRHSCAQAGRGQEPRGSSVLGPLSEAPAQAVNLLLIIAPRINDFKD